jgi:hypothetical protein
MKVRTIAVQADWKEGPGDIIERLLKVLPKLGKVPIFAYNATG